MAVVECIPNVSEGRRADVIEACASSIRTAGAALLDLHTDAAHNRSVYTFAGSPSTVRDAVLALAATAIDRIDLRQHTGVHPRIGAVDVIPLVPISGVTMADCVALAKDLGETLARRHGLPIYFYEHSATQPERRRLEQIRRGEFEGLAARLRTPAWAPDCGPAEPHPSAGASVVGARPPLLAYNVNLASDRLDVAKAIARRVRESSGGLPSVKALGLALADRGIVQVSMNLTNVTECPPHVVFALIVEEAARHGVEVLESEIVGLIPAAALERAAAAYLKVPHFDGRQVLERRLAEHGISS